MNYSLREFRWGDEAGVNRVALAAFEQYRDYYEDWAAFSGIIANMALLSESGELIVATVKDKVAGAVVYVGPGIKKSECFPEEWPVLRMLVVAPAYRRLGIGRALTEECVRRAVRDRAQLIALHTTPIMKVALPMYERMGFKYEQETPKIFGVPYGVYVKDLNTLFSGRPEENRGL